MGLSTNPWPIPSYPETPNHRKRTRQLNPNPNQMIQLLIVKPPPLYGGVRPPSSNDFLPLKNSPLCLQLSSPRPLSCLPRQSLCWWSISPNRMHQGWFTTWQSRALWFSHSSLQSRISSLVTKEPGPHYCSTVSSMNTEWTDPLLGSCPYGNIFDGYLLDAIDKSCNFAAASTQSVSLPIFAQSTTILGPPPPLVFSLPLSAHPSRYSDLSSLYVLGHYKNPEFPSVYIQPGNNPYNKLLFTTRPSILS